MSDIKSWKYNYGIDGVKTGRVIDSSVNTPLVPRQTVRLYVRPSYIAVRLILLIDCVSYYIMDPQNLV